ncbi:hypothetical protein [Solilutibacter pythonis]|uniref:hypothetical protein n=1 Tax=Solilutibacter pythonis TaxID=2483112 RepID=UPI001FE7CC6E|nr:hypothetical protein [Lysobacter pythonis]
MQTAVLNDGAYFLKCFRRGFPDRDHSDDTAGTRTVFAMALERLERANRRFTVSFSTTARPC